MAEKISMLIVKVDLDCHKCYHKMRKILCKLQDQESIRTISFDDKSKTIAVAGPFDPHRLACKIRCRGGKTVKDVQIVDVGGGGKPPPKMMAEPSLQSPVSNGKRGKKGNKPSSAAEPLLQPPPPPQPSPPEPAPAPPPEMMPPPSPPPQAPATPDRGMAAPMPAFHEEDNPKAQPAQLEPPPPPSPSPKDNPAPVDYYMPPAALPPPVMMPRPPTPPPPPCPKPSEQYPVEYVIPAVEIPSWPAAPCGCPCCAPCYQGYYEGCRCGCGGGGRVYGCAAGPRPWCGYQGCRIVNEEDPNAACSVM